MLVLDEPTAGVDIELRQQLWSQVVDLNKRGTTILLTTHYLEEAEELCDQIAIINHGKVIANDTTPNLLRRLDSKSLAITLASDLGQLPQSLLALEPQQPSANQLIFQYKTSEAPVARILAAVEEAGLEIQDISTEETDLEDIFLQLTRGAHGSSQSAAKDSAA